MTEHDPERLRRLLCGDEPPELRASYLARVEEGAVRAVGSSVPLLGLEFERGRSGLFLPPEHARTTVRHLASRYMTAEEILEEPVRPHDIVSLVTRHSAESVAAAAGYFLAALFDDHPSSRSTQLRLASEWTYGTVRQRAEALVEDGWAFVAPQAVLAAAKLAFIFPPAPVAGDPKDAAGNLLAAALGIAQYLGLADDDEDAEAWRGTLPPAAAMGIIQNHHFASHTPMSTLLPRFRRLREIAEQEHADDKKRFDEVFEEGTGTTIDVLFAVGHLARMHTKEAQNVRLRREQFEQLRFLDDEIDAALDLLAADEATFRERLTAEASDVGFDWAFNVFRRSPLYRVDDERFIVIHPGFLLDRICGSAELWETRSFLNGEVRRGGEGKAKAKKLRGGFEDYHARVPEHYVEETITTTVAAGTSTVSPRLWTEAEMKVRWPGESVCDLVVEIGGVIIAIEVVKHPLGERAMAAGSVDALERDLKFIVDHEAKQISNTVDLILADSEFDEIRTRMDIYPVVVDVGGFPWNQITAAAAWSRLHDAGLLTQPGVGRLLVLDLDDIESIEASAERGDPGFLALLVDRRDEGEEHVPLDAYMHRRGIRLDRPRRLSAPLERVWVAITEDLGLDPSLLEFPEDASD